MVTGDNLGIAMSTGTNVAMHAAGITLMRGDPALVADAIGISRRTYRKIRQNLFWAFAYNVIGIPLGRGRPAQPGGGRCDHGTGQRERGEQRAAVAGMARVTAVTCGR
jgi:cation transport ATPase